MVWKAITGYNNYSLAGLLVVGPLFQQSGFSLPLDRDQVRLHNTPLCLERERERGREKEKNCKHVSPSTHKSKYVCVQACMFWSYIAHVCEHVACMCVMTIGPTTASTSTTLDCEASLESPQSPSLHHLRQLFLLPQHKQPFWDPWLQFPSSRLQLNGVVGNLREVRAPGVTHITVSLKQYSGKQTCRPMQA